eukprot:gb/GECH01006810.1/.p1 GENE.gb/GECH01006810.1/~~gb/GECH01006810.1/.p1  ORF type:complete len:179 (+),score=20.17 gb/GECH01006810.1/:1-537(+)
MPRKHKKHSKSTLNTTPDVDFVKRNKQKLWTYRPSWISDTPDKSHSKSKEFTPVPDQFSEVEELRQNERRKMLESRDSTRSMRRPSSAPLSKKRQSTPLHQHNLTLFGEHASQRPKSEQNSKYSSRCQTPQTVLKVKQRRQQETKTKHPSSRIRITKHKQRSVLDGPFPEKCVLVGDL